MNHDGLWRTLTSHRSPITCGPWFLDLLSPDQTLSSRQYARNPHFSEWIAELLHSHGEILKIPRSPSIPGIAAESSLPDEGWCYRWGAESSGGPGCECSSSAILSRKARYFCDLSRFSISWNFPKHRQVRSWFGKLGALSLPWRCKFYWWISRLGDADLPL